MSDDGRCVTGSKSSQIFRTQFRGRMKDVVKWHSKNQLYCVNNVEVVVVIYLTQHKAALVG